MASHIYILVCLSSSRFIIYESMTTQSKMLNQRCSGKICVMYVWCMCVCVNFKLHDHFNKHRFCIYSINCTSWWCSTVNVCEFSKQSHSNCKFTSTLSYLFVPMLLPTTAHSTYTNIRMLGIIDPMIHIRTRTSLKSHMVTYLRVSNTWIVVLLNDAKRWTQTPENKRTKANEIGKKWWIFVA